MESLKNLYYLNPNGYGGQYFVVAESPGNAYERILKYLKQKSESDSFYADSYKETYNWFKKHSWDNLPKKYTLDSHPAGSVIESEIC